MPILAPQQIQAYDKITQWLDNKNTKRFVLSGYAGTGKTTLAKYIADNHNFQFIAYTGKAANVLREKGCLPANTIHSQIYKLKNQKAHIPEFILNTFDSPILNKNVIVDEHSMLSEELIVDIEKIANKVLYLGDNFQLPPVQGFTALKPDFQLTEIHRQALDSNIIRISAMIRDGKFPSYCDFDDFVFCKKSELHRDVFMNASQILCGTNATRRSWINKYRAYKGYSTPLPTIGEKIICLKNNKELGLFNGMMDTINGVTPTNNKEKIKIDFAGLSNIPTWTGDFLGLPTPINLDKKLNRFDFGAVITVHKSQGSEWDEIVVANEPIGTTNLDRARWLYTALTRARKKVYLVN